MLDEMRRQGRWAFLLGWALVLASLAAPFHREPFPLLPFEHTPVWVVVVGAPMFLGERLSLRSVLVPLPDLCLLASPMLYWLRPRRPLLDAFLRVASVGLLVPWLLLLIGDSEFHGRPVLYELMWGYYLFSAGCTLMFFACALGRPVTWARKAGRGFPVLPPPSG